MPPAKTKHRTQGSKKGQAKGTGISKMDAIRQSLDKLGDDAMPLQIKDHLKSKFGIDTDTTLISTYKSTILREKKSKKPLGRHPRGKAAASSTEAVTMEDIKVLKELTDRLGVDQVGELAEVLAK
jgi:hypothetical protein